MTLTDLRPELTFTDHIKAIVACAFIGTTIMGALGQSGDALLLGALVGAILSAGLSA